MHTFLFISITHQTTQQAKRVGVATLHCFQEAWLTPPVIQITPIVKFYTSTLQHVLLKPSYVNNRL